MYLLDSDTALTELGEQLMADVTTSQRQKRLRDTGESAESLRLTIQSSGTIKRLAIYGLARFKLQQYGRGPNRSRKPSREQVEGIAAWLKRKGLDYSPWAVATKQAKEGTPVPNPFNPGGVLSEPLDRSRVIGLAKTKLRPILIQSAKSFLFR